MGDASPIWSCNVTLDAIAPLKSYCFIHAIGLWQAQIMSKSWVTMGRSSPHPVPAVCRYRVCSNLHMDTGSREVDQLWIQFVAQPKCLTFTLSLSTKPLSLLPCPILTYRKKYILLLIILGRNLVNLLNCLLPKEIFFFNVVGYCKPSVHCLRERN